MGQFCVDMMIESVQYTLLVVPDTNIIPSCISIILLCLKYCISEFSLTVGLHISVNI